MSDPQGRAASGEEAAGPEATAHLSSLPQQVQAEAPVAALQTPAAAAAAATEDEESDDESEILEESPCGRWQKRKEEVTSSLFDPKHSYSVHVLPLFCTQSHRK